MAGGLIGGLKDEVQAAATDYSRLPGNYPNAQAFLASLANNISQHVPSNEDFRNPQAMSQWSQAAAMNAPMGLAFIGPKSLRFNHHEAETAKFKLDNGYSPIDVWKEHLTGRGADGKTVFQETNGISNEGNPIELGDKPGRYQQMISDLLARAEQEREGMNMEQRRNNYPLADGGRK
ncbi:MAG: hypothetical protein ACXWAT_00605 [Methylobacter sp.]